MNPHMTFRNNRNLVLYRITDNRQKSLKAELALSLLLYVSLELTGFLFESSVLNPYVKRWVRNNGNTAVCIQCIEVCIYKCSVLVCVCVCL